MKKRESRMSGLSHSVPVWCIFNEIMGFPLFLYAMDENHIEGGGI
jgi:hypothetical protein